MQTMTHRPLQLKNCLRTSSPSTLSSSAGCKDEERQRTDGAAGTSSDSKNKRKVGESGVGEEED